ncbi:MAG: hypothetical protein B6V02_02035 [Thermoprotei archaeon ex4572_64]|nr:MAG: hypothetical protein B6V02_02035 [Thermoprotei archaeon ex4572_64]
MTCTRILTTLIVVILTLLTIQHVYAYFVYNIGSQNLTRIDDLIAESISSIIEVEHAVYIDSSVWSNETYLNFTINIKVDGESAMVRIEYLRTVPTLLKYSVISGNVGRVIYLKFIDDYEVQVVRETDKYIIIAVGKKSCTIHTTDSSVELYSKGGCADIILALVPIDYLTRCSSVSTYEFKDLGFTHLYLFNTSKLEGIVCSVDSVERYMMVNTLLYCIVLTLAISLITYSATALRRVRS